MNLPVPPETTWYRDRALRLAVPAVVVVVATLTWVKHHTFHSTVYDLGIFLQVLHNTARGAFFEAALKHMNYLGDHFSPSLALLAPLTYLPWPVPALLCAQALGLGWMAVSLHDLALARSGDRGLARLVALAALVHPLAIRPVFFDLHPEPFAAALLARALLVLERRRLPEAALWLLLALGCKEDMGLIVAPLGLWIALRGGMRAFGLGVAVVALCWTGLCSAVFMPAFRPPAPEGGWFYLQRYAHLGGSLGEVARTVFLTPWEAVARSVTWPKVGVLAAILAGFAFAPLRGPSLLCALPYAGAHFLSHYNKQFTLSTQYLAPLVPILALAAISGLPAILRRWPRLALVCALATGLGAGFAPRVLSTDLLPRSNHAALHEAIALVPPEASVCADNHTGPHLAARAAFDLCVAPVFALDQYTHFGWPEVVDADYQLFRLDWPEGEPDGPRAAARVRELREAGWAVLFERDAVVLLARPERTP